MDVLPPGGIPPGESHPGHPPGGHPRSRPSTRARVPPTTPREASRRVVFPRRYRPSPPPRRPTARREDTTPPPPRDARASAPPRRAHPRRRRATRPREFVVSRAAKTRRRNEGGSGVGNREGVGNARRGPRGAVVERARRRWDPPRVGARIVPKPPRARTRRETRTEFEFSRPRRFRAPPTRAREDAIACSDASGRRRPRPRRRVPSRAPTRRANTTARATVETSRRARRNLRRATRERARTLTREPRLPRKPNPPPLLLVALWRVVPRGRVARARVASPPL